MAACWCWQAYSVCFHFCARFSRTAATRARISASSMRQQNRAPAVGINAPRIATEDEFSGPCTLVRAHADERHAPSLSGVHQRATDAGRIVILPLRVRRDAVAREILEHEVL